MIRTVFGRNLPTASKHGTLTIACLLVLQCLVPALANAAAVTPPPEKGLLITPLRQYLSASSGQTIKSSVTVANLTDQPLTVTMSVRQFSVTDYVYNYKFEAPKNDWLHLDLSSVTLLPNQSQTIPYHMQIPVGSAPGGHYYTLFASAKVSNGGINTTIQAADLLYMTVKGALVQTSRLENSSIRHISFGHNVPFSLQPIDTGNVHYFIYVSGQLHGLFVKATPTPDTHLLLPGKVRAVGSSIPAPLLPGVYKATYGYRTDSGQNITRSSVVVYIPPWFIAFLLAALLVAGRFLPRKRSKQATPSTDDTTT